jgi:hypothetical protein
MGTGKLGITICLGGDYPEAAARVRPPWVTKRPLGKRSIVTRVFFRRSAAQHRRAWPRVTSTVVISSLRMEAHGRGRPACTSMIGAEISVKPRQRFFYEVRLRNDVP